MTILESLENEIFSLPKSVGKEGMIKYLQSIFTKYKETLELITDETLARELKQQRGNIATLCDSFISSFSHYQKGHIEAAYTDFKKAMSVVKPFLFPEHKGQVANIIGLHKPLFRGRIGTNKPYSKCQMFHLPFSQREFANTQRFSVPGLPCLYLSNSIYVCWEELNRPSLNTFQVSRFQQENFNLKILDISFTPTQLKWHCKSYIENNIQGKYDYNYMAFWFLLIWPLSLVCSLSVVNENAPFKQEYIFPQFLLQWVTYEKDVDGIKYFSVKSNPYNKEDYSHFTNYIFPPKKMDYGNYCSHLKQSFKLSDPFSAEIFEIADPNFIFLSKEWLEKTKYKVMTEIIRLELVEGHLMPYTHTLFGKMEMFMQNLEVDFLAEENIES